MADYNQRYKALKKRGAGKPPKPYNTIEDKYLIEKYNKHKNTELVIQPTENNFKGLTEPVVCSYFGCPNHLTPEQQLYGTKCIHHQRKVKPDPTVFISYPKKKTA